MNEIYDLVIIGAGPAGIAASIYASRAMLKFILLDKYLPGGAIAATHEIENYPGIFKVSGQQLTDLMFEHATALGTNFVSDEVKEIDASEKIKKVITYETTYYTKTIILATGASSRKLGMIGEEKFDGRGISYCATCDGAFYKNKIVAVIGGGDVAVEDAIYLSRLSRKVYVIHRRNELRAAKVSQAKLFHLSNVEVLWDSVLVEVKGDEVVSSMIVQNLLTNEQKELNIDGVFVAVGMDPNSWLLKGIVKMDETGWIITNEDCETSSPGIYAVGDVRKKTLRQVVTSVADGAVAVFTAERYL